MCCTYYGYNVPFDYPQHGQVTDDGTLVGLPPYLKLMLEEFVVVVVVDYVIEMDQG